MTNRNIIEFIGNYGLVMLLLILFVWLALPRIYTAVFPRVNGSSMYDVSGINIGDPVTYNGRQYTVSQFYDMDSIGKVDLELIEINNN